MTSRIPSQRGVALLMMLMLTAIAAGLLVLMVERQSALLNQLAGELQYDQIQQYNHGAVMFAQAALKEDGRTSAVVDHPGEQWAQPFPPYPVPGGIILPTLRDAQSRFNLNSLVTVSGAVDKNTLLVFQRLLQSRGLPIDLSYSLVDWLDSDSDIQSSVGAEDDYYLRLTTPYRAANRALSTFDELRLVRGFNRTIMQNLAPIVTVLPVKARLLNVNFIEPELLAALVPGMSVPIAKELLALRPVDGWVRINEFLANPFFNSVSANDVNILKSLLTVRSDYFELYTQVRFGERERIQWTLLARPTQREVRVLAQEVSPLWVPNLGMSLAELMKALVAPDEN